MPLTIPPLIGTWTPADASGAGLSLTINGAIYMKIGRLVYIAIDVTYPTTASTASATISLPFLSNNSINQAIAVGFNTSSTSLGAVVSSASGIVFYAIGGLTQRTNVLMSTFRIGVGGTYESAS